MKTGETRRSRARLSLAVTAGLLSTIAVVTPWTPTPATAAPAAAPSPDRTMDEALAEAHRTGQPVEATASGSETTAYTANPNGTVTYTQSANPSRKKVDGVWQDLDATLIRNPDGTLSPKLSRTPLVLSGGGDSSMATIGTAGLNASVGAPMALPEPTMSGPTATYASVLPGVDLQITAKTSGGFSEVFVVHDATAADNPDLAQLTLPIETTGLTVTSDEAGNIVGTDQTGHAVLTAPTPTMWDSTSAAAAATMTDTTGTLRDKKTGLAARSSARGPGAAARTARLGATFRSGVLRLTPSKNLLTGAKTKYPVYVDPSFQWQTAKDAAFTGGWATITKNYAGTNYWKDTPDPNGRMQVGNSGSITSRTLINYTIPTALLAGAEINTAQIKLTQTWSYSCTGSRVNLYAPDKTLTSTNASWNDWASVPLGAVVDYKTVAHGYNSSCPASAIPFDIEGVVAANILAGKKVQTFVLRANDETDTNGWKEFLETSPSITITYNHTPNTPSSLSTAPKSACAGGVVGDGYVTLKAKVSDPDGGTVGVKFRVWKSGSSTALVDTNPQSLYYTSGSVATYRIDLATLRDATPANPGTATFFWSVQATDYHVNSSVAQCSFVYDRTRPGKPTISGPDVGTVGTPVELTINPAPGTAPSTYVYQLNGGKYSPATPKADGTATITVIPNRFTNIVNVTGQSAGGNSGDSSDPYVINATLPADAVDGDLTGDGIPDLVTAGAGTTAFPSGLWLSTAQKTGLIDTVPHNIGSQGTHGTDGKPSDFNGAQIITGEFRDMGWQDVLAYHPGDSTGSADVLFGNGDGSTIASHTDSTLRSVPGGSFVKDDLETSAHTDSPSMLANAGAHTSDYPDLIGIAKTDGVPYLTYYSNPGFVEGFTDPRPLIGNLTPIGDTAWNAWTLTGAQTSTGSALFLWQQSTGKLYLWKNLTYDPSTGMISYTQQLLSTAWNAGKVLTLRAADVNGDGTADLWSTGPGNAVTAWLVTAAGAITAQAAQTLTPPSHFWPLSDVYAPGDAATPVATVADVAGTLTGTGQGGATWNTAEIFEPDVQFDGTGTITAGHAVNTNGDFTISLWVKPDTLSQTVLSQDGAEGAIFKIYPSVNTYWAFAMARTDDPVSTVQWDAAISATGTANLGIWYHITATYKKSTGLMSLYVNDQLAGTDTHTAFADYPTGKLQVARMRINPGDAGYSGYAKGQIANIQTWNTIVNPVGK